MPRLRRLTARQAQHGFGLEVVATKGNHAKMVPDLHPENDRY